MRVPAYAVHSHPEAKDIALAALLRRLGDREGIPAEKTLVLLGEVFPADPLAIDAVLRRMGVEATIVLPGRSIGDLRRSPGRCGRAAPPLLPRDRGPLPQVGHAGGRRRARGHLGHLRLAQIGGRAAELDPDLVEQVAGEERAKAQGLVQGMPLRGRVLVSGYEGSELAYARLLIEAGAEVPYVSTSIGQTPLTLPDELWLRSHGVQPDRLSQIPGRRRGRWTRIRRIWCWAPRRLRTWPSAGAFRPCTSPTSWRHGPSS
ncbi:MAG: nitrogenase component 1 [Caldilineaceae bacterium]